MGYNTVAFLLNDFMHELEKSPKAATYGLTHPPMSDCPDHQKEWRWAVNSVAEENNEPLIHSQALEVLGTFHASDTTYLRAGGNCIEKLKVVRYRSQKDTKSGKTINTVTLELPEWWERGKHQ